MEELEWPTDEEMRIKIKQMNIEELKELSNVITESLLDIRAALIREGNKQFGIKD